jgi:hypothetical protein
MRSMMVGVALAVAVGVGLILLAADSSGANGERSMAVARGFLDRALAIGSREIVPAEALRDAVPEEPVVVRDAVNLEPIYSLVAFRSGDRLVGIVAVDADAGAWLWCRLRCRGDRLLPVSDTEARIKAVTGGPTSDALGETGVEAGDNLGAAMLVEGRDKHLYWRFALGSDVWLVDALDVGAAVLGTTDGSARRVVAGPAALGETGALEATPSAPEAPEAATIPASYVIPGMPYHFQITDWYCGPAALQTTMDWFGEEVGQADIAHVANDRAVSPGVTRTDLRRAGHFSGMSVAIQDSALAGYRERQIGYASVDANFYSNRSQRLKNVVAANYPVIAMTWWNPGHDAWHYRIVKGYDDSLGVFVCQDPWYWAEYWGPDCLIDQTLFVDDLWQYSSGWAMIAAPWVLVPVVSPSKSISVGDTLSVDLKVLYPGPGRFDGLLGCTDCRATIDLPSGLALAGGSSTLALPDLLSGDSAAVHWDVVALGPTGEAEIGFQAQGIITASAQSYPAYTDSIGGHARELVWVGYAPLDDWEAEERLTEDAGSSSTCFPGSRAAVTGADGTLHLVWSDDRDVDNEIYYRSRAGGLWGAETRLTSATGMSNNPCIAEGPDGSLHVAWSDSRDGNYEIYYKSWDAVGGWSADERVTDYDEIDIYPAIAAGDSAVYVVWERHTGDSYRVAYVCAAARTTAGWSDIVDVDAAAARDSYRPSVACAGDSLLHVVYERQSANSPDEHEVVAHRAWDGASWSARAVLSSAASFSRTPTVAVGPSGSVHVAWQDGEDVGGDIFYRYLEQGEWQPVEEVAVGDAEACTPSLAVDALGTVHLAWVDDRNGGGEIYLASRDGSGWCSAGRVSQGVGLSLIPTVIAGGPCDLCIVWTDLRSGSADLYFRERSSQAGIGGGPVDTEWRTVSLASPCPQPFSDQTRVVFALGEACEVCLGVYDVKGRLVRELASGWLPAGNHCATWNGKDATGRGVAPGVYFVRCAGANASACRSVVLIR